MVKEVVGFIYKTLKRQAEHVFQRIPPMLINEYVECGYILNFESLNSFYGTSTIEREYIESSQYLSRNSQTEMYKLEYNFINYYYSSL